MNNNHAAKLAIATLLVASAMNVAAAVSAEEAKQLGGPVLTEFGAERAGNKDGTIPEYKAEIAKTPASFDPNEPYRLPNPFNDKPLFSITAQNMDKYADRLTEAQRALFKIAPGHRMDVYPTRRTAYYPKYILDNSIKNATSCTGGPDELALVGCYGGIPFPIPKTGNQVIWNRLTKYVGYSINLRNKSMYITPGGKPIVQGVLDLYQELPIYDPKRTEPNPPDAVYYKLRYDTLGPPRKVGEKLVVIYPMDPVNLGGRIYQYLPGQRRVKLAPDLAYDTPSPQSAGVSTMDENGLFFGAPDRYDFKLVGKKEIFMNYNTYDTYDYKKCPEEVLFKPGFMNSDCMRWELHRAWAVDARIKPGYRHIYPRRLLYFDEDTWAAGTSDNFDSSGKLYRGDFMGHYQYYISGPAPVHNITVGTVTVDFQTGGYYMAVHMAYPGGGIIPVKPKPETYYSPEALAGQGIR